MSRIHRLLFPTAPTLIAPRAGLVLQALGGLEAMPAKVGIPQEIRRPIDPDSGPGPRITVDVQDADPPQVRQMLEGTLAKAKR